MTTPTNPLLSRPNPNALLDFAAIQPEHIAPAVDELLNASHASLRDDYDVSCPELNTAVAASISAGALGARMVGGGFGGSAIALIKASHTQETIKVIETQFRKNRFIQ